MYYSLPMTSQNNNSHQQGFSLVEGLMIAVIAIFIVLVIGSLTPFINLIGSSRYESLAKDIAQKQIEDLRALPFANLTNTASPAPTVVDSRLSKLPQGSGLYTIEDCDPGVCLNSEKLKKIHIIINWKEAAKDKKVDLDTFVANGGLK